MAKNFLGMPVEGVSEFSRGEKRVPQLTQEEVSALIHAVLEVPGVKGLAWTQYTPYFNDGEPCVFGAGDPSITVEGINPEESSYDWGWMEDDAEENNRYWIEPYSSEFTRLVGDHSRNWDGDWPNRTWEWKINPEDQPNPALFKVFFALNTAMENGSCDYALLDLFGDHATIIIDKVAGKVIVEGYDHE